MYRNQKVVVVMPAYNAARTLETTHREVLAQGVVDLVIVIDDGSHDETVAIARTLPNTNVHIHSRNTGYGGNQKSCFRLALEHGGDIVIMVHPDYQYTPLLIPAMVAIIGGGVYPCVLGSRILGGYALRGGMPRWKYFANRALTLFSNVMLGAKLSEYHTGYRAYSRELLASIPFDRNSDDFVFDNEILAQILWQGKTICEMTCPTKYFPAASSINFTRSVKYGLGCVNTAVRFRLAKIGVISADPFAPVPSRGPLEQPPESTRDG